jgi:hypothetical protein
MYRFDIELQVKINDDVVVNCTVVAHGEKTTDRGEAIDLAIQKIKENLEVTCVTSKTTEELDV